MAKKVKKAVAKKTVAKKAPVTHHHWHPHDFFLVVAGGFVVIILIFVMSDSFRLQFFPQVAKQVVEEETVEVNAAETGITIEEFSYSPNPVTVKVGTTVTWTNNDTETHSATADDGIFDTGPLEQGESGSVTFTEAGEYAYHCSYHPNMTGTIVVEE